MRRGWIAVTLGVLAALGAAPAAACSIVATPRICAPNGDCTGPLAVQAQREQAQREAIEYGRAMAVAVEARRDATGLDRAHDVARLVFPLVVRPVDYADDGSCGPEVEDAMGAEIDRSISIEEFEADIRKQARRTDGEPLSQVIVPTLVALRERCQNEVTRAVATYLGSALPAEQMSELWDFLIPRAGALPPADPRQPLQGWRFSMIDGSGTALAYNEVPGREHIDGRRERAWQYLQNHRNGRAVMSAVSQFIESRLADGRGEAAICPVAHAETQRLIAELTQP